MAQLTPYTQEEIDEWEIEEEGVKDGSSPSMTLDIQGSTATRKFYCLWEHRYTVARFFTGDAETYVDGSAVKLSRLLPQTLPGRSDFIATKVTEISGHCWAGTDPDDPDPYEFTDNTMNRFTHAKLTVQYEKLLFDIVADESIESEIDRFVQFIPEESTADYVTVPASTQKYIDSAGVSYNNPAGHLVPVPYPVGLTETTYRFALKWWKIPKDDYGPGTVLWERIFGDGTTDNLPFLNAVNQTDFMAGTLKPGVCMLERVTEQLDPSILEQKPFWTVTYHFACRAATWNKSWFFPNTTEFTAAGNVAKRMLVGRGDTHYAPGDVPDLYSNYVLREFALLFQFY